MFIHILFSLYMKAVFLSTPLIFKKFFIADFLKIVFLVFLGCLFYNKDGDNMEQLVYHPPRTKTGEKTFLKIIEAGKQLFAQNGFHATSVNLIIEKAQIAIGTFYIYFDNKLMLYLYLLQQYKMSIRQASREAIMNLTSRYDIEKAGIKAFLTYVHQDPLAYKVIWESLFVDPKIFIDYYSDFSKSYIHQLQKHVPDEVTSEVDLETLSFVLMGISNFVGLQVLFKKDCTQQDIESITNEVMKILSKGIFIDKAKRA